MTKKLATVVTTTTTPATTRKRTQTDSQATSIATVSMLGQVWTSLTDLEKSTWVVLAQQIHSTSSSANTIGIQPTVNPYLTFVSANSASYAISGTVDREAQPLPSIAPPLPPCLLTAELRPGVGPVLTLETIPYPHKVLIYGASPVPAGQNIYKKKGAFKLLGGLPGLGSMNDLGGMYNSRFRANSPGSKIAIKIVGISQSGARTAPLFVSGITAYPTTTALPANDDTQESAGLKVA